MMENNKLIVSSLGHTWLIDIDGTIAKHNGYKIDGEDTLLKGVKEFFSKIPDEDYIIFLTSRKSEYSDITEKFLKDNDLRYNQIVYNLPYGERIVVNDDKTSGLCMSHAIRLGRDEGINFGIEIDKEI